MVVVQQVLRADLVAVDLVDYQILVDLEILHHILHHKEILRELIVAPAMLLVVEVLVQHLLHPLQLHHHLVVLVFKLLLLDLHQQQLALAH